MAKKLSALVGVDIGANGLRAVEVSADGRNIKRFASAPLKNIKVDRGVPSDPTSFADVLRDLFRDLSPSTRSAVFGAPAIAVTTRVLDVPQVPDGELKSILEGEVQHFGIVRGFGGMFDYGRLSREASEADVAPQALVMACEALQLNSIRDAAERSKVTKAGIEPTLLGLIRLAATRQDRAGLGMLVALAGDVAEVAVVHQGKLKLYRRIDLGADSSEEAFARAMTGQEVPAFLRNAEGAAASPQLSLELGRTLDYVAREYKALGAVEKVVLAVSEPKEAEIKESISEALHVPVELATAPLPGDDGILYGGAYGLVLAGTASDLGVPSFDLSPYDPLEEAHQQQRRIFATSLAASIAILVASIAVAFFFGQRANHVEHALGHEKDELAGLRQVQLPEAEQRQAKLEQFRALSANGLPIPQIVDSLAASLDPKAGIQEIQIDGVDVKVTGEAVDEASMIRTLDQIRKTKGFKNAYIESFDQNADPERKFVAFKLSAQLGASPVSQGVTR